MSSPSTSTFDNNLVSARWNSLKLYNGYRIVIALMLLISHNSLNDASNITSSFLLSTTVSYLLFSIIAAVATWFEKPKIETLLPVQIISDVIFILLLMYAGHASHNGLGLLLS